MSLFCSVMYSLMHAASQAKAKWCFHWKEVFCCAALWPEVKPPQCNHLASTQNYQLGKQTQYSPQAIEKNRNLLSSLQKPSSAADSLGTINFHLHHFSKSSTRNLRGGNVTVWCLTVFSLTGSEGCGQSVLGYRVMSKHIRYQCTYRELRFLPPSEWEHMRISGLKSLSSCPPSEHQSDR